MVNKSLENKGRNSEQNTRKTIYAGEQATWRTNIMVSNESWKTREESEQDRLEN